MRGVDTPIGQHFHGNRPALFTTCLVAFVAILVDYWLSAHRYSDWPRLLLAGLVVGVFVLQRPFDGASLGFRAMPMQPIAYWFKLTSLIAAVMLIPILAFSVVALQSGWEPPRVPPDQIASAFVRMCVVAPILEELLYRFAICCPATAILGPTGAIVLSGLAFAGLHFIYGNPGPDNFIAGYVLAWIYLKSGSLLLPVLLHSIGNAVALLAQACNWYLS